MTDSSSYDRGYKDGVQEALSVAGIAANAVDRAIGAIMLFQDRIKDPTPEHINQWMTDGKVMLTHSLSLYLEELKKLKEKLQ